MSINKQKILRYIPIANLITMFFWVFLQHRSRYPMSSFVKQLFIMLGTVLLTTLPRIIASRFAGDSWIYTIVLYLFLYIQTLAIAFIAVRAQEKIHAWMSDGQ